jgi:hypothetical protein
MLDPLYFGYLSCFTILNDKYIFQICEIFGIWAPFRFLFEIKLQINLSKPNPFETEEFVQFRQGFGLHRFKLHRHLVDGTVKSVWLRQVFGEGKLIPGFYSYLHCVIRRSLSVRWFFPWIISNHPQLRMVSQNYS